MILSYFSVNYNKRGQPRCHALFKLFFTFIYPLIFLSKIFMKMIHNLYLTYSNYIFKKKNKEIFLPAP
jgi:hypothetical protein